MTQTAEGPAATRNGCARRKYFDLQLIGWYALTIPFAASVHAYWRIRHNPATDEIVFETAPDASGIPGSWTVQHSVAREIPMTAVYFELRAGTNSAEPSPGTAVFDTFRASVTP